MEPEIIIVVLATFVGGGAMGATGMLLCQWVVRKMSPPPQQRLDLMDPRDVEAMKADVADLSVRLHSVDARLDFTEQLLGGALSGARPPESLPPPQAPPAQGGFGMDAEASWDGEDDSSDGENNALESEDVAGQGGLRRAEERLLAERPCGWTSPSRRVNNVRGQIVPASCMMAMTFPSES